MTRSKKKKDKRSNQQDHAAAGRWKVALCAAVIIIAAVAAYWNSFDGVFVHDDLDSIRENEHIRQLWPPSEPLSLALWNTGATVDGRPVLSLSFAIDHALFGPEPWGRHLVNLAIHIAAALLLFGIIRRTLNLPRFRESFAEGASWMALSVAVIWAVHPLQTGAVTYIVQRAESLMGMFYLLTVYCAIRVFEGERARWWSAAAVVACALGMGTKEVIASAPVIVFLYDYVFVSGSLKIALRRRWGMYAALGATWLILAGLLLSTAWNVTVNVRIVNPIDYVLTQPGVILYYLRLVVWPRPLVIDYNWPLASDAAAVLLPGILIVGLVAASAWGLWRRRWWGFVGAWFFLILAPSSSFYPLLQNLFEHRMYLPLAAAVVLAVVAGRRLLRIALPASTARRAAAACVVLAVTGAFGYLTGERNVDYRSERALWQQTVDARDESFIGHSQLAKAMRRSGEFDGAIKHYRIALKNSPTPDSIRHSLGIALTDKARSLRRQPDRGREADALLEEAVGEFRQVLVLSPEFVDAHTGLGNAFLALGRVDEAVGHYKEEIKLQPRSFQAHYNLAMALTRRGKPGEAIGYYELAVTLEPTHVGALAKLGHLLKEQGQPKRAIVYLDRAVALLPRDVGLRILLSQALAAEGKPARTVAQLEKVVELAPDHLGAANDLAWLLATCPVDSVRDGRRAAALARRTSAAKGDREPALLDTLAAAYAEIGDFPKATKTARQALKLAELNQPGAAALIRMRLALYEAGKPYRERR